MQIHKDFRARRRDPFKKNEIKFSSWGISKAPGGGFNVAVSLEMIEQNSVLGTSELDCTATEAREFAKLLMHLADVAEGKAEL